MSGDKLVLNVDGFSPLFIDFNASVWQRRRHAGKKQGVVQACKPAKGLRIIDATAGWGRDAVVLASFGAEVVMIERNSTMAALLKDALQRLPEGHPLAALLTLVADDAKHYLETLTPEAYPDVIYIDPMHPIRQKSALVKKDMQVLQRIIGPDEDAHELIQIALTRARQRVVVKWPQHANPLRVPNRSYDGKTVRFDVFTSDIPNV
jgi:16S rRNA (guanine1516-N2)-methyltransferase